MSTPGVRTALLLLLLTLCLDAHAQERVAAARRNQARALSELFSAAGVAYPPGALYLRALKHERQLEVWAGPRAGPLTRVTTYPLCAASGVAGPKRQEGDLQVPEGFYTLDLFNPRSAFHLSLRVSYPNEADRLRGRRPLGGAIMVHGNCVSIGCLAIQDGPIEQLYVLALDARARMGRDIPIHLFPRRLDAEGLAALEAEPAASEELRAFWRSLAPAWEHFERTRRVPRTSVHPRTGAYLVRPP